MLRKELSGIKENSIAGRVRSKVRSLNQETLIVFDFLNVDYVIYNNICVATLITINEDLMTTRSRCATHSNTNSYSGII